MVAACRRIVLVGFMGAGKSTVAALLGSQLGWRTLDLDDEIATARSQSISDIFAQYGEAEFRRLETEKLAEVLARSTPLVLALGGGAVESSANRDAIGTPQTCVFYLEAPLQVLRERCAAQAAAGGEARPLLHHSEILFEARASLYASVGIPVATFGFTAAQVAQHILSLLQIGGEPHG